MAESEKAKTIKGLRRLSGQSQSQFAERFGIPVRTLQQWEQGRSEPPVYVFKLIKGVIEYENEMTLAEPAVSYGLPRQNTFFNGSPLLVNYTLHPKSQWKICIDRPFPNCEKIYPIQQKKVRELIDDASADPAVQKIVIFGSSITSACHMGSDVDVYAEMTADRNPVSSQHDFEYDFWNNYTADDRLKKEILKKGVCVYVRDNNAV